MAEEKLSKTHARYWEKKLVHPNGTKVNGSLTDWYIRLHHGGKQSWVNMQTPNRTLASQKAKEAYFLVRSQGWDALWAKYGIRKGKEKKNINQENNEVINLTIGELVRRIKEKCSLNPKTLNAYATSLRKIAADIFGANFDNEKHDNANGENKLYIDRLDEIKICDITPGKITQWMNDSLKVRVKKLGKCEDVSKTTINSYLRNARKLFSKEKLKATELYNKIKLPFEDIVFFKEPSHRYVSKFDIYKLLSNVENDLKYTNNNAYVAFLLGACCGMRKNEIDKLEWQHVKFESGVISIHRTKWFNPKTDGSDDEIKMEKHVIDELMKLKETSTDSFVLTSKIMPRTDVLYQHYRCEKDFKFLYAWLRSNGVDALSPLHTLRKEYGSIIAEKHGLTDASKALRHKSLSVTQNHYTDRRNLKTAGLFD